MPKKIIFILLALNMLPRAMEAQVVFNTIEDVWRYADTHNVTMRTAKYEVEKATNAKKQAYGALLPQATTTGSFSDNTSLQTTLIPGEIFGGPPGTYRAVQFGQKYIYNGSINAQMDILNLESWFNVQIARQTEALSKDSLASIRKTIYQQLATQYYSYLLMKEAARLAGQSASIADSVYESANNKYKEGTVNEGSVDVAKINLERAQQTYTTAQYQMMTAKNNLKALLNLSLSDSLDIDASLESNIQIDETGAFSEDPAIRLALRRMEINQSQYHLSKSAFVPTLSILYNKTTQQNDNTFEPFSSGGAPWFQAEYWSLRASFPIFTGGTRWFQVKRSKLTYYESRLQYESAQKQSAINDENLKLAYRKSVTVLNQSNNIMQLSFDNYQHASYRYESGIAPIDDRLNAFNDYISYQNQYLNNLSDMLVQLYQVKIRQTSF